MEWLYLLGSVASIISVLLVVLALARRRQAVNERTFRVLVSLMVTIGFIGIGIIAMFFAQESIMRGVGAFMTIVGTILLFVVVAWTLWYTAEKGE